MNLFVTLIEFLKILQEVGSEVACLRWKLEELKIYVTDLYVSIPSAKSTINARISSLIEDGVFKKVGDLTDGRRQQILLTGRFRGELMTHINISIALIKQDIC